MKLSVNRIDGLPPLAWASEIDARGGRLTVLCGSAVEVDDRGLIAGAWAGPFSDRAIEKAATSIGTALRLTDRGTVAVTGTASASPLFFCRLGERLVASNTLAFALAVAGDRLRQSYPFYIADLASYYFGSDRYRHTVATERGSLSVFYGSMTIGDDCSILPAPVAEPPVFVDFAAYRSHLVAEAKAVLANAADPARRLRYRPLVALSAGYDSPAAAVIAHEAGCREGMTFGQPVDPTAGSDSGHAIGRMIGLSMTEFETFSYKNRTDLPEIEFVASNFGGGQVYLADTEPLLAGRMVVSGYGGDRVWNIEYGRKLVPHFPIFIGGYSHGEFYARAPAIDFAIPMIGARRFGEIGRLSRSPEMRPWSIGGEYDRPIARRIVEEAGIPRGEFAERKRRVAPDYDNFTRRGPRIENFLSARSLEMFEAWFAREKPLNTAQAKRHALLSNTVGRVLWSGKLKRALGRLRIAWPPFPARILHLKIPVRKNAFLFTWAVGEQVARYRNDLAKAAAFHDSPSSAVGMAAEDA